MNVKHYQQYIVRYTLYHLGLHSKEAELLVLGTAVHESLGLKYIKQFDNGPAMGFVQMEAATHDDIWKNYLHWRPELAKLVCSAANLPQDIVPIATNLIGNMNYGATMCRIHYLRQPGAIPRDLEGQARYWKKHYNTSLGKGTVNEYMDNWDRYVN